MLAPWKKSFDKPRQHIKTQRHHFSNKGPYSQSYGFSSSHVWMWELNHKEGWAQKNWCFQIMVLGKTLESPLNWKKVKPVNPKGNLFWIFIVRTDAEVETLTLWPLDAKSQHIGKVPDAGKDEGRRRRGQQRMRWLDSITDSMGMNLSKLWRTREPVCVLCHVWLCHIVDSSTPGSPALHYLLGFAQTHAHWVSDAI